MLKCFKSTQQDRKQCILYLHSQAYIFPDLYRKDTRECTVKLSFFRIYRLRAPYSSREYLSSYPVRTFHANIGIYYSKVRYISLCKVLSLEIRFSLSIPDNFFYIFKGPWSFKMHKAGYYDSALVPVNPLRPFRKGSSQLKTFV
jgi:hypothetical protein